MVTSTSETVAAVAESADSSTAPTAYARRPRRWITTAARRTATVVSSAAFIAAGYEGWLLVQQRQIDLAATQAVDAAVKYAVALTSANPETIDHDITDVLDGATGDFKDTYTKASTQLRKKLIEYQVVTKGFVVESAVKTAARDRVEALLLVQESVVNSTSADERTGLTTVRITMENVNGRWLASKVTVLPE